MQGDQARRSRMIAVAFGPRTMAEALAGLARIAAEADIAELRLDLFAEPFDLPTLLRTRTCPVVATLRPRDQGGRSTAPADERFRTLLRAAELGAEYVDLEWDAAIPERVAALGAAGAQVVISRHDFATMPADFVDGWWPELAARGATVVKLVGTARDPRDCLSVFRVLRQAERPTVAIAMGEAGLPTRILALREPQCFLTYAALEDGQQVAPGQVSIRDMHSIYQARRLGPGTAAYGLLGPHPETERAAQYNAWFAAEGVNAVAVPFVAREAAAEIVAAFRELPIAGWHIHGEALQRAVLAALDELAPRAAHQGKVNAIVAHGGALRGDWVESPEQQYALWLERARA